MTILQVYHTVATGGVGSYLLNLCTQLAGRGHRVMLAAPDGELTHVFRRAGIECHHVRIADWRLPAARRELARLIRDEQVEMVNAHDYSAGAPTFLAARATAVPYLLTIHCHRPAWQRFIVFYWSPTVLAMSPSVRAALIHRLGLPSDRVVESFNGVDTVRFSPGQASASLAEEFGVSAATPIILHASRLSSTKSPVAMGLIGAALQIAESAPGLQVLVAGAGEDEARVRVAASRVNERAKRALVRVVGGRADVPDLMRLATVVVGTGNVALEAMATGCALVAAGKAGFFGLVTPESFPLARAAWFGDHEASAAVSTGAMAEALRPVLVNSSGRRTLGDWGRQVMRGEWSIEQMTDHVERVYASLPRRLHSRAPGPRVTRL